MAYLRCYTQGVISGSIPHEVATPSAGFGAAAFLAGFFLGEALARAEALLLLAAFAGLALTGFVFFGDLPDAAGLALAGDLTVSAGLALAGDLTAAAGLALAGDFTFSADLALAALGLLALVLVTPVEGQAVRWESVTFSSVDSDLEVAMPKCRGTIHFRELCKPFSR